jgi:hypothetical protein
MRVSIDDAAKSTASTSSSKSAGKPAGEGLDQKQKIKAGVAAAVIVLAIGYIAYSQGIFESRPKRVSNPEPTPEQLEQINKQAAQEQPHSGARLAPTMPLGAQ